MPTYTSLNNQILTGWSRVSDTWTYASSTTITVPSDATLKYQIGDKIRLKQGGAYKYFYISVVASTLLTITGGSDYTLTNAKITDVYVSSTLNAFGFPSDWTNFTPSYTNVIVGNGVNTGAFVMIGKTVFFRTAFTFGSTSSLTGTPVLTYPVTISTFYSNFPVVANLRMGVGAVVYVGILGTGGTLNLQNSSSTYLSITGITSTTPATWATNDSWAIQGFYEVD